MNIDKVKRMMNIKYIQALGKTSILGIKLKWYSGFM
jgi:hypothetical protein